MLKLKKSNYMTIINTTYTYINDNFNKNKLNNDYLVLKLDKKYIDPL